MFTVSVRFNRVSVRALKQSIVPCKLLISASRITVFVGSNITDATPIFSTSAHCSALGVVNSICQRPRKRWNNCELISLPHKPQHLRYFFNRETHYLIQLCVSGIVIRAFLAIIIP